MRNHDTPQAFRVLLACITVRRRMPFLLHDHARAHERILARPNPVCRRLRRHRRGDHHSTGSQPLHLATRGGDVRICRISDRDPAKLRAIEDLGLLPGIAVRVVEESVWEGPVEVEVNGARIAVPLGLARAIHVEAGDE